MSNFSETGAVGSSKPTFEQRLDEYFNMPVKTEDSSGGSALSAMNRGTSVSAGKPSLRDRMAEIGKKISEAHKNRKIEFRKWYMKSKFKKLEKKYKKTYGYAGVYSILCERGRRTFRSSVLPARGVVCGSRGGSAGKGL